jgi:hypothetical protein
MWDQKRLLSEPSGEFQPFPHICPTDQRTPKGLQTGAHGSAAGSGASRIKARTAPHLQAITFGRKMSTFPTQIFNS